MTIVAGILLYIAGIVTGAGLLTIHEMEVKRAVTSATRKKDTELAKLRAAYDRLQEDTGALQQAQDCRDAYRRGKAVGRSQPMSEAERFAKTFEGHRAAFVDTTKKE